MFSITTFSKYLKTLEVLNFAFFPIFDHFREILFPRQVLKTRNHKIKYPQKMLKYL